MPRDLYLHLGLHKTSSSAFQATCKVNQKFLSDQGITYPLFRCKQTNREDIENHSLPIFSLFSGKASKYHINIRRGISDVTAANREYRTQLDDILANSDKVILSGEDISALNTGAFSRLIEAIRKYNYNIKPFALVRDPYSFMNSAYQQMIKSGNFNPLVSLGAITESKIGPEFDPPNRNQAIKNIIDVFGESVQFYPFRKACEYSGGPVRFILKHICGVRNTSSITLGRRNQSRSNLWTRVQNQCNRFHPALINGKPNSEHIKLRKNLFADFNQKFNLTESEFNLIREPYSINEDILHKLLGDDFMSNTYTFSEPVSNDILTKIIIDYATLISDPRSK